VELELIAIAVGLAVAGVIAVCFGIPNIVQGRLLARPLSLDQLKDHVDDLVVVFGTPEPREEIFGRHKRQILWQQTDRQERVSSGRNSYWRTVRSKVKATDFFLHFPDGGKVFVYCEPTEVQDAARRVGGDRGFTSGSYRSLQQTLPLVRNLTVMGLLHLEEEGAAISAHPRHGLFFSPQAPQRAARKELLKGWGLTVAGVLAAASAVALAACGL